MSDTNQPIVIDLTHTSLEHIRQTYIDTFGPLPEQYTANDIDWDICNLIKLHKQLTVERDEVHAWIVCAPIATPTDMMQNADRIIEITLPL